MTHREAIVVGAGPAGLAAAAALTKSGVETLVLEQAGRLGASWSRHYDRLRLHTTRHWSSLPGYRIPRRYGRWVSRDGVIAYLHEYAAHHALAIQFDTDVTRIDRNASGWELATSAGSLSASHVVLATGYNRVPYVPPWPGREQFRGEFMHSSEYRNPAPFQDRDVLVVGVGNSGAEIAADLAEGRAARVRLSVRTPPQLFPKQVLGIPAQAIGIAARRLHPRLVDPVIAGLQRLVLGDLSRYGLPRPIYGAYEQFLRSGVVPTLDIGMIAALKRGRIEVVDAVQGLDGSEVVLADGSRIRPHAVIAATGYRPRLESLVAHLGILGHDGRPAIRRSAAPPVAPRLYFIGFTQPISGTLREMGVAARHIARTIARQAAPLHETVGRPRA